MAVLALEMDALESCVGKGRGLDSPHNQVPPPPPPHNSRPFLGQEPSTGKHPLGPDTPSSYHLSCCATDPIFLRKALSSELRRVSAPCVAFKPEGAEHSPYLKLSGVRSSTRVCFPKFQPILQRAPSPALRLVRPLKLVSTITSGLQLQPHPLPEAFLREVTSPTRAHFPEFKPIPPEDCFACAVASSFPSSWFQQSQVVFKNSHNPYLKPSNVGTSAWVYFPES